MGESLENYIKDIFAGTLNESDEQSRAIRFGEVFSYQGNQNNPPDMILRNGDAIEVKKIESSTSTLALNSSYPKAKIFVNSPMITTACRNCEVWQQKDIMYAVGVVGGSHLKKLFFVYGVDYAACGVLKIPQKFFHMFIRQVMMILNLRQLLILKNIMGFLSPIELHCKGLQMLKYWTS